MSQETTSVAPPPELTPMNAEPKGFVPLGGLLTKKELAEYLKVHPRTVTRKVTEGAIPAIRIGSAVRFDLAEVIKALGKEARD